MTDSCHGRAPYHSRAAEELNESVLDDNAEFVMSRLNRRGSDVRKERSEAMSGLIQRANATPVDLACMLQNLKDIFSDAELAGTRAFSLKGAGSTMFTVLAEFYVATSCSVNDPEQDIG
jgi:hypothetical protein